VSDNSTHGYVVVVSVDPCDVLSKRRDVASLISNRLARRESVGVVQR